jgi:hypothetical protein
MKSTHLSLAVLFLLTGSQAAPLQDASSHLKTPMFIMLTSDHRLTSKNENLSHQFGVSGKRMRTEKGDIWIALTRRRDRALEIRSGQVVRDLGILMVDTIQLRRILEIWASL